MCAFELNALSDLFRNAKKPLNVEERLQQQF